MKAKKPFPAVFPSRGGPPLGPEGLERVAARFRLLADPTRLALLQALHGGELSVSDLAERVGTSQPNVSKHLRLLAEAGMVARRAEGNATLCRIADPTVERLCEVVCEGLWGRLAQDAHALGADGPRPARR